MNQKQIEPKLPVIAAEILDSAQSLYSRTGDIKDINTMVLSLKDIRELKEAIAVIWEVAHKEFQ